ncbi:MAG: M20 aminoacylase family protein [bacterium]
MTSLAHITAAQMTRWRRHLHRHPEIGFEVHDTARYVADALESFGIEVFAGVGETGVVGVLRGGDSEQAIGLRADMDALPIQERNRFAHRSRRDGAMHACGHDGHTAMLLGAARELSAAGGFNGVVHFIFQPNEEHGLGAQAMIDDGLFERFPMRAVFGMHNLPGMAAGHIAMRSGAIMASEDNFIIAIKGRGGHAAQPHHHIDPLVIAAEIILALQTIVARNLDPNERAVVSVTEIETDGAVNVVPSEVVLKGDCRCFSEDARNRIEQRMQQLARGICAAHGAALEFSYRRLFHAAVNDADATRAAGAAAVKTLGAQRVELDCEALTISEDFASMLRVKAGCYVFIGNGEDSVGGCMLHNPHYDFNDEIMVAGANYWTTLTRQELA